MAVNKFDNSMFDAGTIGTTANKLLQLDGSTKIPAVDGSLLTGIPSSLPRVQVILLYQRILLVVLELFGLIQLQEKLIVVQTQLPVLTYGLM